MMINIYSVLPKPLEMIPRHLERIFQKQIFGRKKQTKDLKVISGVFGKNKVKQSKLCRSFSKQRQSDIPNNEF
jgi:hypothetical protein